MTNISALKNLYTSLGGSLTDSYDDIADGAKVGDYSQIADGISAVAKKATGGENVVVFNGLYSYSDSDEKDGYYEYYHWSIDATFNDVMTALESGKTVIIELSDTSGYVKVFRVSDFHKGTSVSEFKIVNFEHEPATPKVLTYFGATIKSTGNIGDFTCIKKLII